jgi:hypothetical protein
MKRCFAILSLLTVAACGGSSSTSSDTPEEMDAFQRGGGHATGLQELGQTADALFNFDPTIDVTATAGANAQAIRSHVTQNLSGCGMVALSGTSVSVNFGSGCQINKNAISGSLTASVSKSGGTVSVSLVLTNLIVDGKGLDGTATFATTNGSSFEVTANLMIGGERVTAQGLTISGNTGMFTMNGAASVISDGITTSLTFNQVAYTSGDCYPSGGALVIMKALITETITFSPASASSGTVSVTIGRRMSTKTLPSYGSCPR